MKAKVEQTHLANALQNTVRATAFSHLPVLNNILIETKVEQHCLCISATDLEHGIRCLIPAEVMADGAITAPAKTMQAWVKTIDTDVGINLSMPENTKLLLKAGAQSTLTGIAADEFPPFPSGDALATFTVEGQHIMNVLAWTGFAVSKDEARPVLTGICMVGDAKANAIEMYSADGFRAGKAVLPFEGELAHDFEVIMPAKSLTTLSSMRLDGPIEVQVIHDRRVRFTGTRFEFWLSTIEAKFPDVNQVIPSLCHIEAIVSKPALLTALKRVQAFSDDVAVLFFNTSTGDQPTLEVYGESIELGQTETLIPIELQGQAIKIGFNVRFLADIVAACPSDKLVIGLTTPEEPALIRPQTNAGEKVPLWVLMPMHLSAR